MSEIENIRKMVKELYQNEPLEIVQKRASNMYDFMISKGYNSLQAQQEILSHGIKYNDLMSGILTKGIDG
jgi:hypothetical protein